MTTASSACLTCGIVTKSGKLSCCARGGSWFGKCGAPSEKKRQYAWHEGIEACKARQSRAAIAQVQNGVRDHGNNIFDDAGSTIYSDTGITVTHMSASVSAEEFILNTKPSTARTNASIRMSNTVAARTSIAHNTGATPSKIIATTTITFVDAPFKLSTRISGNSVVANKSDYVSPAEASMRIIPFHKSVSVSITAHKCESLLCISFHIHTLLFIAVGFYIP